MCIRDSLYHLPPFSFFLPFLTTPRFARSFFLGTSYTFCYHRRCFSPDKKRLRTHSGAFVCEAGEKMIWLAEISGKLLMAFQPRYRICLLYTSREQSGSSCLSGRPCPLVSSWIACFTCSSPSFFPALVPTTGTPNFCDRRDKSCLLYTS